MPGLLGRGRDGGAGVVIAAPGVLCTHLCSFAASRHCEYNTWKHKSVREEETTQWL